MRSFTRLCHILLLCAVLVIALLASCCCVGGLDGDEFTHDDDVFGPGDSPHSEGEGGDV